MKTRKVYIICGGAYVAGKEIVSLVLGRGLRDAGFDPDFVTSLWTNGDFTRRLQENHFSYRALRIGFISATLRLEPLRCTCSYVTCRRFYLITVD
jgi:hypothetical protein